MTVRFLFVFLFPFVVSLFSSSTRFCYFCYFNLAICINCLCLRFVMVGLFFSSAELPSTKLHTLLLDHHNVKLTWYIDWPKKEVLFNVDDAFTDDNDWFSFGFSKRGQIEGSDVCFFVKSFYDESYNEAIVSIVWRLPPLIVTMQTLFISNFFKMCLSDLWVTSTYRTRTSERIGKCIEIYNRTVNCFALMIGQWRSSDDLIRATRKTLPFTSVSMFNRQISSSSSSSPLNMGK